MKTFLNFSTQAAKVPTAGAGLFAYCASKAAQDMITRCMAVQLGEHKIRVNRYVKY
jgi:NAD(P)-dependent dehydrogenase (short-subunit alcohol dehydrogenase family)